MGVALRNLRITVGAVLSGTSYRALETPRLAQFLEPHTYYDLAESGRSAESSGSLQAQVAVLPAAATNTVIITQAANISDAFPRDAKALADGEAPIYRPDSHGEAPIAARVKIEDWPKLAAAP
jgi:hypothetical protein